MAKAKIDVLICDICGTPGATTWTINRTHIDLCENHAEPLQHILAAAKPPRRAGKKLPSRPPLPDPPLKGKLPVSEPKPDPILRGEVHHGVEVVGSRRTRKQP